jgi:hypothetical protein
MRAAKEKMRLTLFVSVLRNVQRAREVNHQCRGIGLRVNAKERKER